MVRFQAASLQDFLGGKNRVQGGLGSVQTTADNPVIKVNTHVRKYPAVIMRNKQNVSETLCLPSFVC